MPFRFFSGAEISEIRAYFDQLLAAYLAAGKDSYSISTAHLRHGRVYDILTNPKIVAVVRDLLGPNVVAWGSHFFCKMPGDGKAVAWHQDASYWPLTPSRAVTVWLAIDDADRENACMRYIPGTHRYGHLTWKLSETDEANVLNQTVEHVERFGEPVDVELRAGEAAIHSDLLLHGSEVNTSSRRRCGLTLRYTPTEVRAGMGWHEKGVIVSGEPSEHWGHALRPQVD
jgi:ectoine hydroxylase-related dioxygenase (phytanoyl-CoA dioxygenase family)